MKTTRIIHFMVSALLLSAGCALLLLHGFFAFSTICFCLPGIVLMRRSEFSRPVQRQGTFGILIVLLVIVSMGFLLKLLIPESVGERIVHDPGFVLAPWVLMMVGLFWRWRKERKLSDT